jgi:hypothetical protein
LSSLHSARIFADDMRKELEATVPSVNAETAGTVSLAEAITRRRYLLSFANAAEKSVRSIPSAG